MARLIVNNRQVAMGGSVGVQPGVYREVTFHEADSGTSGTCETLGEVIVSLIEDHAAGMKWVLQSADPMFRLFDESKKGVDLHNQERVFRFEPQAGTGTLVFAYKNPWVANSPVVRTAQFTVTAM